MRPALPPPRRDVAAMLGALCVMLAVALPLSKLLPTFQYIPPVAVAVTGLAYLGLANLLHKVAEDNLWERSTNQCAPHLMQATSVPAGSSSFR